jgi:CHC2-type zinc finger protein/DnaB helicase-like protein
MKHEHDREEIIVANPLLEYCQAQGLQLKKDGPRWKCLCPLHQEKTPSFTITPEKNLFKCFGCGEGGSVIDLHSKLRGISIGEAMRDLSPGRGVRSRSGNGSVPPSAKSKQPAREEKESEQSEKEPLREVIAYDYHDATGKVVYQVVRYEPKTFKQCQIVDGKRVWNMEGVERLPYRLPELLGDPLSVWIVEGERDVETLRSVGQTATCNPAGVKKWLPAFSQYLRGKCVYIAADNDLPGQEHGREVLKSLEGIVEWVKWIELPKEHNGLPVKDVTDLRSHCPNREEFLSLLAYLQGKARLIDKGVDMEAYTMVELEQQYIAEIARFDEVSLSLANWLPAFNIRPLIPGDVLGIIAGTGQLKSAAAQNILACNPKMPALFFQLEISGPLMFERGAAIATEIDTWQIHRRYREGETVNWRKGGKMANLLVSIRSLNMKQLDEAISRSSAKLGSVPRVVVIDYVQLIKGEGTRYERVSEACEEAKRLAKKWNTIAILLSQIARKYRSEANTEEEIREVSLCDAKESGSFEDSCSVVLGMWKTSTTEMKCRVLKNTKGLAGNTVAMKIRDGTFIIEPA